MWVRVDMKGYLPGRSFHSLTRVVKRGLSFFFLKRSPLLISIAIFYSAVLQILVALKSTCWCLVVVMHPSNQLVIPTSLNFQLCFRTQISLLATTTPPRAILRLARLKGQTRATIRSHNKKCECPCFCFCSALFYLYISLCLCLMCAFFLYRYACMRYLCLGVYASIQLTCMWWTCGYMSLCLPACSSLRICLSYYTPIDLTIFTPLPCSIHSFVDSHRTLAPAVSFHNCASP